MRIRKLLSLLAFGLTACAPATDQEVQVTLADTRHHLSPTATTSAVEQGGIVNVAIWSERAGEELIVAALGGGGVDFYRPTGERAGSYTGIEAGFVSVLDAVTVNDETAPLLVVYDGAASTIGAYRLDGKTLKLRSLMQEPIHLADELTGLCHYRSPLSGSDYIFAATDGGLTLQYELFAHGSEIAGRLQRTIPTGKDSGFCAVDAGDGSLYISEEGMGIWRLGAEPESDTVREPVDLRAPWGSLSDEIKGIGVYRAHPDVSYLVAADVGESHFAVYGLPELEAVGTFSVEGLAEAEGVMATNIAVGSQYPHGFVAIADEDESGGGTDAKLVAWHAIAGALGLPLASDPAAEKGERPVVVKPVVETEPVESYGDAADDPAIWVNPVDASRSLVIGTNKQRGLYVYDLEGRPVQTLADGNMNNVDLRYGFPLGGESVALVAASNRSNDSIAMYRVDADALRLVEVAALPTGFLDPYGLCMYTSAASGEFYVFVNEGGEGTFRQWRLFDNGEGKVAAEQVREFPVGSQSEGCVADDELGFLYVGEENRALWKYSAEPDGGTDRVMIDSTDDDGRLEADVEGVALWLGENGSGYLVASNQGADNYAVYRREGDNAYVGHFHVVANSALGIDGASETDGLDLTSAPLGERYPAGLLVVQDGRNIAPEERQNFKFVSWQDVLRAWGRAWGQ